MLASIDQAATGGWIVPQIRLRQQAPDTYLSVTLEFKHTGLYGVAAYEIVGGTSNYLGGNEIGTYSAGHQYRLRIQAFGNTVRAKVWDTAEHEYDHWQVVGWISDLLGPGQAGVAASAWSENTNTDPLVTFREFGVPNPQAFTVTRSTNGIRKAQAAGTGVRLTNPLVLAL